MKRISCIVVSVMLTTVILAGCRNESEENVALEATANVTESQVTQEPKATDEAAAPQTTREPAFTSAPHTSATVSNAAGGEESEEEDIVYASYEDTMAYMQANTITMEYYYPSENNGPDWFFVNADGSKSEVEPPFGNYESRFQIVSKGELVDCGDYYEVQVYMECAATLPEHVAIGESTDIVINEITGETVHVTRVEIPEGETIWGEEFYTDGELDSSDYYSNGTVYAGANSDDDLLLDAYGSCDPLWVPCYYGTIRIAKNAIYGVFVDRSYSAIQADEHMFFNVYQIDENGCMVSMFYNGD